MISRPLSKNEINWINQILKQESSLSDSEKIFYQKQINNLKVTEEWDCCEPPCGSVNFNNYQNRSVGFADGEIAYRGKKVMATLFCDPDTNKLTQLEIITD
ncbi:MAG: hypothetical protein ACFCAD_18105 [Pleurocapsa sp.]